ncbi:MAG: cysteine--tRNA ligase [Syntrophales bacterium]|nr:cysteine--tRNA ligase [Syntrophales bacterium]
MAIKIYNTLSRSKEEFKPLTPGKVGIYTCGITAYDYCHIGHARSAVVFDVITRYFRYRGYDVKYVKNFTDVDDKIIEKAQTLGTSIGEITEKFIAEHDRDMEALGVMKPTVSPRATENIDGMIELIKKLLDKNLAYVVDGDVYFAVDNFPCYGKLSGRSLEEMMAGARVEVNVRKKNPLDFALWKASKEGEPSWESPWGRGRPGWHIECSVMSQRFLGETFDIHGGGEDLIFPHHENEIAQSEGATGKPLARYWVHNGFVRVKSEKMSKSLGNIVTIRDILERYHPEVLRLFIISSHYRSPIDFSPEALSEARMGMERLYNTLKSIKDALSEDTYEEESQLELTEEDRNLLEKLDHIRESFIEAMDDDFNTARALGFLFDTARSVNSYIGKVSKPCTASQRNVLKRCQSLFQELGQIFGIFNEDPDDYFRKDREREAKHRNIDLNEIEKLLEERHQARLKKDWVKADEIRQKLLEKGITLKDTPKGTEWGFV